MSLRAIHDFELELLEPCLAMLARGIRIDELRRLRMLADIEVARGPLGAEAVAYALAAITAHPDRLNGKAHLFRERKVCACCRNGKAKRLECWECAGFEKKPTKKMLAVYGPSARPLGNCDKCSGAGEFITTVFNPASPDQVKVVLYDVLRLPARTKDGKLTTDERALKSLLADAKPDAQAFLRALLRLGKLDTIAAILVRIAPGEDGRIRCSSNPAGTETGRFSLSETFLIKSTNLGNMPKREAVEPMFDVRACFIPDEGHVFVEADLSGAELWITAAASADMVLLDLLRSGKKLHRWFAARVLSKAEADVTESEYHLGKTSMHGLGYGMQWKTFMENVNAVAERTGVAINASQAKMWYGGYHSVFPRRQVWWKDVQAKVISAGQLTTCFGRTRKFYGRNKGDWLGPSHLEMMAYEPQSSIADLLNRGLLRWWRQHDGKLGLLLAQVYDSVLIQCKREHAQICATMVKRCLTEEIEVHGIKLTVPVDVKVLESWAVKPDAKEAA